MNIQNLLKKLSDYPQETKKEIILKQPYKVQTSESFGTFNSVTDHSDTSFVLQDNFTPIRKKHFITNQSNLDEELCSIDRMKQVYEKRQKYQKSHNKSIEKSIDRSNARSSEKHLLKPSNTPSFNKIYKLPAKAKETSDSSVRNIYKEEEKKQQKKASFSYMYPKSPQSNQYQHNDPYEDSSLNFESQKDQEIFNQQFHFPQKIKSIQAQLIHKDYKQKCDCSQVLQSFMQKTENRFQYTLNKLQELEKQNKMMKLKISNVEETNMKYKEAIEQLFEDRQKIHHQRQIQKQQKAELQGLLKDVLFKREREKLQTSKQNSHRENERKNRIQIDYSKPQHHKSTQSKMKVQNLLQKLQIKVDRT